VRRIMDAWIFQGGYPAITVGIDGDAVRFDQRRYLPSGPDDTTWPVPLLVRQTAPDGSSRTEALLVEAEGTTLPLKDADAVVVANAGGHSFVRVFYDDALAARITAALDQLSPLERYALVDDAWAAVVDGTMTASAFCRFVEGFRDETDLPTWQLILTGLNWCDRFLDGDARDRFRDFVRDLVTPGIRRLGWEPRPDESDLTRSLRGALVQALAGLADDPEAKAQARELELGAEAGEAIDPHLAAAAVQVVANDGDASDYERFRGKIADPVTPQEEIRYLQALAAFRDPELMARTLEATLTDDVRSQDAPFLLARSTLNRDLGWQAWRFIAEHWEEMNERFASSNVITLTVAIKYLSEPDQADEVAGFFRTHDVPQAALQLRQNLERQRIAVALRERAAPDLRAAFGG
jgi:aminopeptidase N